MAGGREGRGKGGREGGRAEVAEPRLGFGAGWGKQRGSLPALGTEEGTEEGSVLCPLKKNTQPNSFKLSLGGGVGGGGPY